MENKTPLQTLRADFEAMSKDEYRTITVSAVMELIDQLLPLEKQQYRKCFEAGYQRGEDQRLVIKDEGNIYPDFHTYFSRYEPSTEPEQSSNQ